MNINIIKKNGERHMTGKHVEIGNWIQARKGKKIKLSHVKINF